MPGRAHTRPMNAAVNDGIVAIKRAKIDELTNVRYTQETLKKKRSVDERGAFE